MPRQRGNVIVRRGGALAGRPTVMIGHHRLVWKAFAAVGFSPAGARSATDAILAALDLCDAATPPAAPTPLDLFDQRQCNLLIQGLQSGQQRALETVGQVAEATKSDTQAIAALLRQLDELINGTQERLGSATGRLNAGLDLVSAALGGTRGGTTQRA